MERGGERMRERDTNYKESNKEIERHQRTRERE